MRIHQHEVDLVHIVGKLEHYHLQRDEDRLGIARNGVAAINPGHRGEVAGAPVADSAVNHRGEVAERQTSVSGSVFAPRVRPWMWRSVGRA